MPLGLAASASFLAGAFAGSFISVVAHRLPRGLDWVAGRSRCPGCGEQIAAFDNVPVLSWLALSGRCRSCGEGISARYPLAEAGLGALFAGTVLALGSGDLAALALGLVFCATLLTVTLTDLDMRVIPNKVLLFAATVVLAVAAFADPGSLAERGISAVVGGGLMLVVSIASRGGMGMGDVKLVAVMGLYLGEALAPAVLIGLAAGAMVGTAMIAREGAAARKKAIPFGPFLALGGVVGLWFGPEIVAWYTGSFFGA